MIGFHFNRKKMQVIIRKKKSPGLSKFDVPGPGIEKNGLFFAHCTPRFALKLPIGFLSPKNPIWSWLAINQCGKIETLTLMGEGE